MQVMARGYEKMLELQARTDVVLKGFVQNQLLAYRPDAQGLLQRVDDHWPEFDQRCPRKPPGRSISFVLAQWRGQRHVTWVDGEPPEPQWDSLDTIGNYLHQTYDQEEPDEEIEWDFRFHGLQLTEEQVEMMKPAAQREPPGPPVPEYIQKRFASVTAKIQARRKQKIKSRWGKTLASRKTSKAGQKWSKQVEAAGSKAEFAKKLIPKAVQKASRRSFSLLLTKNAKSKAKGKAKNKPHDKTGTAAKAASTKDKAASGGAPAKPWTGAMQWSVIKDHPLLKKVVRVVGASSCPEHIGKQGTVELVQICECAATGAQHSQVSLSIGKAKMCHVDLRDCLLYTSPSPRDS